MGIYGTLIHWQTQYTISLLIRRCDSCIAKGRSARNDDGNEEEEEEEGEEEPDEDCTCAKIQKVTFKDSARFLSAALAKLTTNLRSRARPEECTACTEAGPCTSCAAKEDLSEVFQRTYRYVTSEFDADAFPLLTSKQIYPYS